MRKLKNEELNRLSPEQFKNQPKAPIILILDNIRSMNNVGSAFRTSDAFLVEAIYLTGITAQPPHRDINKTALGATETVAWQYFNTTQEAVDDAKAKGFIIAAVEQADNSTYLNKFEPKSEAKYAFVFGNEAFGVEGEIVKQADICLEIPQYGTKHSLNISVSIGVVLWGVLSKIGFLK
ncbi:MAG: TrmH family RNA methyltransferase [Cyclobacteriaceae bacterium]|nr:TrmH family RNA methyltransferase [Cyclobacteriaceae bacterium]